MSNKIDEMINFLKQAGEEDRELFNKITKLKEEVKTLEKEYNLRFRRNVKKLNELQKNIIFKDNNSRIDGYFYCPTTNTLEVHFTYGHGYVAVNHENCIEYESEEEREIIKTLFGDGNSFTNVQVGDYIFILSNFNHVNYRSRKEFNYAEASYGKVSGVTKDSIVLSNGMLYISKNKIIDVKLFKNRSALDKYIKKYKEEYRKEYSEKLNSSKDKSNFPEGHYWYEKGRFFTLDTTIRGDEDEF